MKYSDKVKLFNLISNSSLMILIFYEAEYMYSHFSIFQCIISWVCYRIISSPNIYSKGSKIGGIDERRDLQLNL